MFTVCSVQVNALQQRVNALLADLDKRQDEYSEMIAGLTRSHEDQVSRQAAHLAAVMEQRVAELTVSSHQNMHGRRITPKRMHFVVLTL